MRLCVTGGCYYNNDTVVNDVLDELHAEQEITLVAHGACPFGGADILAELWAKDHEVPYFGLPAQFKKLGKKAGPLRNAAMLDMVKPDLLFGFPGGAGTNGCIAEARKRNIEVRTYE